MDGWEGGREEGLRGLCFIVLDLFCKYRSNIKNLGDLEMFKCGNPPPPGSRLNLCPFRTYC